MRSPSNKALTDIRELLWLDNCSPQKLNIAKSSARPI
jgi:hypothetical protein